MTLKRTELEYLDFSNVSDGARLAAVHPGEVLLHDFLQPLAITQKRLALALNIPPRRISMIIHGTRSITADTALRLARFFGTTPEFWLALQASYDMETTREKISAILASIQRFSVTH
jgi:addiction module HigA family antidote